MENTMNREQKNYMVAKALVAQLESQLEEIDTPTNSAELFAFAKGTKYKGMERNRLYTLEELGL